MMFFAANGCVPAHWSAGPRLSRYLRLFVADVVGSSVLMMAAHRWSHTMPAELPPLISWAQRSGFLIDRDVHALHHVDYNINFAILNGHSNPAINWLTAHALSQHSRLWLAVLIAWGALPLLVGRQLHAGVSRAGASRGSGALVAGKGGTPLGLRKGN